jgi:hypothetical protein
MLNINSMRWILAGLFFLAFIWMASVHAWIFIRGFYRETSSLLPIFGGLLGMLAVLVAPLPGARQWWWLPFIIDCGSLPMLIRSLVYTIIYSKRA